MPNARALPGSPPQATLTPAILFDLLRRGRATLLLTTAATSIAFAILAFLLPTTYTASTSLVAPTSSSGSGAAAALSQLAGAGALAQVSGNREGERYLGILKSRTVSRAIVARFHLVDVYKARNETEAEQTLANRSLFELGTKDSIVTINVTDRSPERARDLANAYVDELRQTNTDLSLAESSQRRLFYEQRVAGERDDLAAAETALKQDEQQTGLISPTGQTTLEIQTLAGLRAQISAREVQLAALRQEDADENPDVVALRSEIGSLRSQVAQRENGQNHTQSGSFTTAQVPQLQLDYVRKFREVKYHEALLAILGRQYEAARLDEAHPSPLQVLDRATLPDVKSAPHRSILLLVGLILGVILGVVRVLYRSLSQPHLASREHLFLPDAKQQALQTSYSSPQPPGSKAAGYKAPRQTSIEEAS